MILLTGPNVSPVMTEFVPALTFLLVQMAGKSTLLRMTCAAVIMAQRAFLFRCR